MGTDTADGPTHPPGTTAAHRPVRVAIVGAGPAGFYTAGHLLAAKDRLIEVDMLERLPTPWGLVRSGVAPDHPKIKSVTRVYERIAKRDRFRFYGNVELGKHISRDDLAEHYHAVVYATGAPGDRPLGIPGEDLAGSFAATEFVGWYNGHPDHCDACFDLSCSRAVVVGNGNVALDVARMLMLAPSELACTDAADHALEALRESRVQEVVVVGRRGPAQAAFTNPELLELGEMEGVDVVVDCEEIERALATPGPAVEPTAERNVKILRDYAARASQGGSRATGEEEPQQTGAGEEEPRQTGAGEDEPQQTGAGDGERRRIVLRFLLSPTEILGDEGHVKEVVLARNELVPGEDGSLKAKSTGELERIDAGLVFRAIGYRGMPLDTVPFDHHRAVIANHSGRVTSPDGSPLPGEYVVGWIKRGPSGVIGTNKRDAQETVDAILADIDSHALPTPPTPDPGAIERLLRERQPALVTYGGWDAIDRHERAQGELEGRPRVKLTRIEEMLQIAAAAPPTDEPLDTLGTR